MPIKYNNFDIGNAYLGNDNLVAMYQGSNLVWTNGIKLKSLFELTQNNISGSGVNATFKDNEITFTTSGGNRGMVYHISLKENHKYFIYFIGTQSVSGKLGLYVFNSSYSQNVSKMIDVVSNVPKEIYEIFDIKFTDTNSNVSFYIDQTGTISSGKTLVVKNFIILDLTQAKLDTLTAEQVYNLITLNGTDFTDLELLASGYEVKLGSFKSQETNTVDLGTASAFYPPTSSSSTKRTGIRFVGTNAIPMPKNYPANVVGNIKLEGYETKNANNVYESYTDKTISGNTDNTSNECCFYICDYDFIDKDSDYVRQALTGKKLTYELANKNNIAGSKYGFIDLSTLNFTYQSANNRFYTNDLVNIIKKPTNNNQVPNMFAEKYGTLAYSNIVNGNIYLSTGGNLFYYTSDSNDTPKGILVYELNYSLGNKLDNYNAEQVYYMFFATLGMSKMYVPYGKRFESSDNIILGTKNGIIDLGEPTWYKYTSGSNWIFYATIPNGKRYGSITGLNVDYWLNSSKWKINQKTNNGGGTANGEDLQVFWDASNSQLLIKDLSFTDGGSSIKSYLKGKYLIFPLAEPNGTDYNDLTAKEMYDVINDNQIDIFVNGKTLNSVRSLLGKQNVPYIIANSTTSAVSVNGETFMQNTVARKPISLIQNHKYFICIYGKFQNKVPDAIYLYNKDFSVSFGTLYVVTTSGVSWLDTSVAYGGVITSSGNGEGYLVNRYMLGYNAYFTQGDIIEGAIIIDLTEHNLQNLTAQEAYQYFKENNLFKMTTTGVINIGGLKK